MIDAASTPTNRSARNLVEALQERAQRFPEHRALTFLVDGETEQVTWTYADLDQRARQVAQFLRERTVPGDRAVLVFPPSLDYIAAFYGCLYAGVIAVPTYMARLNRSSSRILTVIQDSSAAVALTNARVLEDLPENISAAVRNPKGWYSIEETETVSGERYSVPNIGPEAIAFLQYTSGSTATPRGVMVSHGNLLHNFSVISEKFGVHAGTRGMIWLPPYHDMGLIGGILHPMHVGIPVVLMPPLPFIQRPYRWLKAISDHKSTASGGPNFAYDLCVERITPEQRATLDLSSWEVAFNGAEPIRSETLERFASTFAECGFRREAFYPCYGMAESTLMVTGAKCQHGAVIKSFDSTSLERNRAMELGRSDENAKALVSSGTPTADQKVFVVDPETGVPVNDGAVGEIWVSGPSIATGYWNKPEETDATFGGKIEGVEGTFLRTGDLGFVHDGELFVTGRKKDLIIVRGTNYYPQDIEATVGECHDALRGGRGAAFSVQKDGDETLVIVHEVTTRDSSQLDEVITDVTRSVAQEHELRVSTIVLVGQHRVPKTSSGKIQRRLCRQQYLDNELSGVIHVWNAPSGEQPVESKRAKSSDAAAINSSDPFDLGVEFFRLVLDPKHLVDSAAVWESADSLTSAQESKFVRLAELADIRPDSSVLDIGCGWGGFLNYAADALGARKAAGLTIARREAEYIAAHASRGVEVACLGWSQYKPSSSFDSIVCAGALEHFVSLADRARGNGVDAYRKFFKRCRRWMKGTGKLAIETLVSLKRADSTRAYQDVSILSKMFPHSSIPTMDDLSTASLGLFEISETTSIRVDYEKTLESWLRNLHEHRDTILSQFGSDVFERFDRYFEASLRQATGGYVDLVLVSFAPIGTGEALEEAGEDESSVSTGSFTGEAVARTAGEIQDWITKALAGKMHLDPSEVDVRQPFSTFGLDSLAMVSLVGELETWLNRTLAPTLGWDYPSIEALSRYLAGETTGDRAADDHLEAAEPIAIIGMACRFPGAKTLDDYWRVMIDQVDAIREIPKDRWNIEEYFDKDPDAPGKMITRWGGFLDDIDQFDPQFFSISPREAARMDPQQRLLLEVTWEALENAGLPTDRIGGSKTGVFVGIGGTDYSQLYRRFDNSIEYLDAYCGTGNALSIAANRISYILDLHGPSLSVDTACSSALVAIHYAAQSLRNHDCDMAIAGGVNAILSPEVTIAFSKARMLSPDGRCKTFDADANGYVRGEGCGVVLFKRLSDAVRDGDNVLAVLRGTAVNQDGKTTGITAPNGPAQQECVRKALRQAGVNANELTYIEAHGTGTPLGDPIEVGALRDVVGSRPENEPPCYMGSIKSNIGHLETASGVAGLIRVILMMQHGIIPPQRNFKKLNPHIKLDHSSIKITTEPLEWTGLSDHRRLAGVSGFGFGGTNAHLIVEAYRPAEAVEESVKRPAERPVHLLPLSAQSDSALREYASRFVEMIDSDPAVNVADLAYSAATTRTAFDFRLIAEAASTSELRDRLAAFAEQGRATGVTNGPIRLRSKPKIAFLFTGQGSQYSGMAKELYDSEPTFRRYMDECDSILRPHLDHSLLEVLFDANKADLVDTTTYTQPCLFAVEYSIAQLWRSWGIEPSFVLGHSVGEFAAATIAGSMSLEDGLRLIATRAKLMGSLPAGGMMAVIFASESKVKELLPATVSIAAINGPENTVISGPEEDIRLLIDSFESQGIRSQALTVSHAFHSSLLDPMLDEFESFASRIAYHSPQIPVVSNLTGKFMADGAAPSARYWREHARGAVRFADGMQALAKVRCDVYLEVGPHPSLIAMGRRCIKANKQLWVPSLRKGSGDWSTMAAGVSNLFIHGVSIDWHRWDRDYHRTRLSLPTYPFQRQRYWMEEDPDKRSGGVLSAPQSGAHPLLGSQLPLAVASTVFNSTLSTRFVPSLKDHVVQGSIVLPGAAYLETALAAAEAVFGPGHHRIENMSFQQALFLAEGRRQSVQVIVSPEVAGSSSFQFLSMPVDAAPGSNWGTHAAGILRRAPAQDLERPVRSIPFDLQQNFDVEHDRETLYDKLRQRGMEYGTLFQVSDHIWKRGQQTLSRLVVPEGLDEELPKFHLHPAIIDACIQMFGATIPEELVASGTGETYLPTGIAELHVYGAPEREMWVFADLRTDFAKDGLHLAQGDITVQNASGQLIAEFKGVTLTRIGSSQRRDNEQRIEDWVYGLSWEDSSLEESANAAVDKAAWLVFGDDGGVTSSLTGVLSERGIRPLVVVPGREYARTNSGYRLRWDEPADYHRLMTEVGPARILHLWSLRSDLGSQSAEAVRPATLSLLSLVNALESKVAAQCQLAVVTRGGQATTQDELVQPSQAAVWGLSRVIANERLELPIRLVDLDPLDTNPANASYLVAESLSNDNERQSAYRRGQRRVLRLTHQPEWVKAEEQTTSRGTIAIPSGASYRLEVGSTPTLDRLSYKPFHRTKPGAGELEIEVAATGLNFSDVLKAMGLYPGLKPGPVPIGIECSGRVTAIGEGVTDFNVGDEVLGVAPFSFGSHAVTNSIGVVPKPKSITHEEAATIPIAFLTAHYALLYLARIEPGEKVLIHAGAGGVGLAAIQICQAIGAQVFATAGSDEKRDYLRSLGVEHVFNSRTLDFAEQISEITDRKGVDVVLNSLPGEAITKSIESLGAYGRFLEIGKTDIYQNKAIGLYPFQNNLSYFAIDLDKMLREKPSIVRKMFVELIGKFNDGTYKPLPATVFPAEQTVQSFRYMAQRKNTGKVIVSYADVAESSDSSTGIRADGAYWITGGTGALGLEVAKWLARSGARELVLFGRSEPNETTKEVLAKLEEAGCHASLVRADVGDREQLQHAVAKMPSLLARPIGVFHAAGILDDGVLAQQTRERFERVLRAKVDGAWNLHEVTLDAPVDHFVLFSSVASIFGSPGQGNYAAGNAFLDGLAAYRRAHGLPGISINWGPWAEVGMAARLGEEKMSGRGIAPIPPVQGIAILERLLHSSPTEAAVMNVAWDKMLALYPDGPPPIFSHLADATESRGPADRELRSRVLDTPAEDRLELLQTYFVEQIARVMELDPARIDPEQPMNNLGLDSLMAIELKNGIESSLGISLPMAKFLEGPSAHQLATMAIELLLASVGQTRETDSGDTSAMTPER